MGNLHQGHLSLIEEAQQQADIVVVSIFVNPMQFNNPNDLENYPQTMQQDIEKLEELSVDLLFRPDVEMIYPDGADKHTQVEVPFLSDILCGEDRPGHFRGVTTIVCKLFNLVKPDIAIFGEKDFQQLAIIRKMVKDLAMPIKILSKPTIREKNGLAMSSRNNNLSKELRPRAFLLNQTLNFMREEIISGNRDYPQLIKTAKQTLKIHGFKPEYIVIANQENLQEANNKTTKIVILAAAYLGFPRLIDNVCVEINN
jgi:pantoate--beta-alanine ligase